MSSLSITLPNAISTSYISQLNFYSPSTPTTLTAPSGIVWYGDSIDAATGAFVPEAYTKYIVILYTDDNFVRGVVQGYYTETEPMVPVTPTPQPQPTGPLDY